MEDRFEEDDREALAALPTGPRPRKGHSYSQQLRIIGIGGGGEKRGRKHSLDEDRIPKEIEYYSNSIDFNTSANNTANGSSNHGSYHRRSSSDDLSRLHSHAICITGGDPGGGRDSEPLEEFIAAGATGVLKAPIRAAVHPHRPPALELRPHPLRETQGGKFLRTIECTDTQLWAGQESGVRFWYYKDMFEPGTGLNARVRRGDEDAAPFHESGNTAPTLCMLADEGNKVIWTGHKDGKIRSWKMDILVQSSSSDKLSSLSTASAAPFKEGLSWQAHKGPVLSLVISAYGDIWTGSEGGAIRVWPWESVGKSLALSPDERHMAALLVERSVVDLRSQVTVNGVCHISSSEVKAMLSDYARGKVWCAGQSSFSLWDARTKELLKVFNTEGQIENRADMPTNSLEQTIEDEMKVKFVAPPKKEKSPGFLQRSRNAIMGAADAVRRVATRGTGAFNEDLKKTESLVMTPDGMIWSGCSNGTLIQWDGNGNRLQDFTHHASPVLCFCTHGSRLWIGYASGMVQMLDLNGNAVTGWISHSSPIVKLALGGGYVYSLAAHGGLRAWNLTSPGPLDGVLRTELAATETLYTKREQFKILVGTWNVSQGKPSLEALKLWLSSSASDAGIVVVGLQEVEMGAGFLAMSAAKETVGLEGSAIGQLWQDAIGKAIEEGPTFERVGSRQLAALLICIWVRKSLRVHVGDLDVAAVACGLGRTIGNKGGVGLRLRVYNRIFCFVNCHLAAHLEAVNRRNADFDHIFRTMVFTRQSNLLNVAAAAGGSNSNASQGGRSTNSESGKSEEGRPDLSQADMVIFFGDFNYRLKDITYDEARDLVSQRSFDWLREKDQLRAEMGAGKVFQGMREAIITFPPTYKFEKHIPGLGGYDSGEKKRIPAWCDRIIYRDNRTVPRVNECSLDCPVISSIQQYDACMEVTESDHKPVRCKLNVHLAHVDRSVRRKEFGNIMKSNDEIKRLLHELSKIPETMISTDNIVLQNQETFSLRITNKSDNDMAAYRIICEGQYSLNDGDMSTPRPRCSFGFPSWLEVAPAAGILNADHTVDITVRHIEIQASGDSVEGGVPQNWWSEDTKDKEVVLRVCITGMSSTEVRIHRVQVHHSFTSKTNSHEPSRSEGSKKRPGGNPDTVDRG